MDSAEEASPGEGGTGKGGDSAIDSAAAGSSTSAGDVGGFGGGGGGKKVPSWLNSKAWSRPARASADGGKPASMSPRTPGKGGGEGSRRKGDGGELRESMSEQMGVGGGERGSGGSAGGKREGEARNGGEESGGADKVGGAVTRDHIGEAGRIGTSSVVQNRAEGWHEMESGERERTTGEGAEETDAGNSAVVRDAVPVAPSAPTAGAGSPSAHSAVKSPPVPGRPRAVTSPAAGSTPPLGPRSPRPTVAAASSPSAAAAAAAAAAPSPRSSPSLLPIAAITAGLGLTGGELTTTTTTSSSIITSSRRSSGGERRLSLLEQLRAAAFSEPIVVAPVLHGRVGGALDPFTLATASAEDQAYERRLAQFYMEISQQRIALSELRRLAMYGIPNEGSLRPVVWKLLLGLLPLARDDWESELAKKRAQYESFTTELIINPSSHAIDLRTAQGTPQTQPQQPQQQEQQQEQQQQQQEQQQEQGADMGLPASSSAPMGDSGPALWDQQHFHSAPPGEDAGAGGRLEGEREEASEGKVVQGEGGAMLRQGKGGGGGGGGGAAGGAGEVVELHGSDASAHDHPLNDKPTSVWRQYFQDSEIFEQIDRDVRRTHPEMPFFTRNDGSGLTPTQVSMRRLLLIFAKLNPGIRYVQGMNEVLAPIIYVFANDPDKDQAAHAEADAFFCFVELLSDFRDFFCQQLDNSVVGIRSAISRLAEILRRHDEELWRNLEFVSKVNPQFYAFRWITLLLTQEFGFPQILRIWDALLSCPEGPMDMLLRVCCAMLMCVRERLLAGDFTNNLKLLQRYPRIDIEIILRCAERLHT